MKTVAEVLRGAVMVLDEHGWTQGQLQDDEGHCCAAGAIYVAATGNADRLGVGTLAQRLAAMEAMEAVENLVGASVIGAWNDAPGRTVDEVKAALLAAAERAEAGA